MQWILDSIDPGVAVGWLLVFLLLFCVALLYRMRDPTEFPRRVALRVRCPHQRNPAQRFTIETGPGGGPVYSCSVFPADTVPCCDQACLRTMRWDFVAQPVP